MALSLSDIPVLINKQNKVSNKNLVLDSDEDLQIYFQNGLKFFVNLNGRYYLAIRDYDNTTYIPQFYFSKNGRTWSKKVSLRSDLTGDTIFNSICLDYDPSTHLFHFVYTADSGPDVYYISYNILTKSLGTETQFTTKAWPPACITSDKSGGFLVVAPKNADPAEILYEAFKDGSFVKGDLTSVIGSSETNGPNQIVCQFSKRDKLFHVLVAKRNAKPLAYWTYNLETDKWKEQSNRPFPDIIAVAPNDPTGADKGKNFVCSLYSDQYDILHAVVQETANGKIHYCQKQGSKWTTSELVYDGTDGNLNPSVGVDADGNILVAAVDSSVLKLFQRTEKDRFEAISNSITSETSNGISFGFISRDRALYTAFEETEIMRAAYHEVVIEEQTTFKKIFQWFDENDVEIDVSSYEAMIEIREGYDGTVVGSFSSVEGDISLTSDGKVTIILNADKSESFNFGGSVYSLKVFKRTGNAIQEGGGWTSTTFDVDNGSSKGVLTANGGTPFSGLVAGDYISIQISTSGSSDKSGIYKISTVTSTVITLTSVLNGVDSSGSTDITIYELDKANIDRIAEGPVIFSKEVATIP